MQEHNITPEKSLPNDMSKDKKKKPKRNVADTSIEAWKVITERGQPQKEMARVWEIFELGQPVTSRRLCKILNLERGNVTKCLWSLQQAEKIKVAFKAKCPVTNMTVRYYAKTDWEPPTEERGEQC